MRSWEWNKTDRKKMVDFISKNNYTINTSEWFKNIKNVEPNYFEIGVIDGYWTLSIYKIADNNYIVITDDVVGDGNSICTFEYKNEILNPASFKDLFGRYFQELLIDKNDQECNAFLKENEPTFDYNFRDKYEVKISSWYLKENESKDCLKGSSLLFKFNQGMKKFDLVEVNWRNAIKQ